MPPAKTTEAFILEAKAIHGDKNDYTDTVYKKAVEKVAILCRVEGHGVFHVTPNNHISKKSGCPTCAKIDMAKRHIEAHTPLTRDTFIEQCNARFPDLLDFTGFVFINEDTEAEFTCRLCRYKYHRNPTIMLKAGSHGCGVCVGGIKDTLQTFLAKARLKGFDKLYDYSLVEYINALTKIRLICIANNHEFEITPAHHLGGDGCRRCIGYYKTTADFILLSKQKFGEGLFCYDAVVFVDMMTHVTLTCPYGHVFEITPQVHLREYSLGGCKDCQREKCSERMSYTQSQWIELAIAKHGDTYLYNKVVYINSQTGVYVVCRKHGPFQVSPACHLGGTGCRKCGIERCISSKLYTEADTVEAFTNARILHNGRYEYIRIFRDEGRLMIEMRCPTHGIISQRLDHHLHGHGCDRCVPKHSKQQIEWLDYCSISHPGIRHAENSGEYRIPGTSYKADGFDDTDTNTVYEYQGDFWHGNPSVFNQLDVNPRTNTTYGFLYQRTQTKIADIKSRGYRVVEVWEREWVAGKKAVVTIQKLWKIRSKLTL
jgi:hypothetical protein